MLTLVVAEALESDPGLLLHKLQASKAISRLCAVSVVDAFDARVACRRDCWPMRATSKKRAWLEWLETDLMDYLNNRKALAPCLESAHGVCVVPRLSSRRCATEPGYRGSSARCIMSIP